MAEEHNVEVMRRLAELWERGEHEAILDLLHEDVVTHTTPEWPVPGPYYGREGFLDALQQWLSPWDRLDLRFVDFESAAEQVAAHGRWVSRGQASGVENTLDFGALVDFDDGLIRRIEFFRDPADARPAAGG
ncbi:MAG TPA: nuclear transport factor 2 family protein [Thermoleophilaceae bacterium]|jgi:ketosteroid isomerase-like protein|nr:nuclear transport factor 2 family protein [Thermoleophilaceae bacterium]